MTVVPGAVGVRHAEAVVGGALGERLDDRLVGDGDVEEAGPGDLDLLDHRAVAGRDALDDLRGQLPRVALELLRERQHAVGLEVGPVASSQQRVGGAGLRQCCREGVRDALVDRSSERGDRGHGEDAVPSGVERVCQRVSHGTTSCFPPGGRLGEWVPSGFGAPDERNRKKEVPIVAQQSTETDWVSRFADEVIAEAERRAPGKPIVVRLRSQPVRPDPPGQPPRGHDPAPGRRRDPPPRLRLRTHPVAGTTTTGTARSRPVSDPSWAEHIGKPLTSVPAPPGSRVPRAGPSTSRRRWTRRCAELGIEYRRHQPDRAVHLRRLPRAGPARDEAPRRTSTPSWTATAPRTRRPAPPRSRARSSRSRSTRPSWRPRRAPARRTRTTAARAPPATSRTSRTAAAARRT